MNNWIAKLFGQMLTVVHFVVIGAALIALLGVSKSYSAEQTLFVFFGGLVAYVLLVGTLSTFISISETLLRIEAKLTTVGSGDVPENENVLPLSTFLDVSQDPSSPPDTSPSAKGHELAAASPNGGIWLHNGSKMGLYFIDGGMNAESHAGVEIRYIEPRPRLIEQGVEPGTLLFNGADNEKGELRGTARIFSKQCGDPLEYPVYGPAPGEHSFVLESQRPIRRNCELTGETIFEELQFTIAH